MLIRFHATTDTPGTLVESLTETEHAAIAEAHTQLSFYSPIMMTAEAGHGGCGP